MGIIFSLKICLQTGTKRHYWACLASMVAFHPLRWTKMTRASKPSFVLMSLRTLINLSGSNVLIRRKRRWTRQRWEPMSTRRQTKNVTNCCMSNSTRARTRDRSKKIRGGSRGSTSPKRLRFMSRTIQPISSRRISSSSLVGLAPWKAFTNRGHSLWSLSKALAQPSRRSSTWVERRWTEPLSPSSHMRLRTSKSKPWSKSWISKISCNIRIKRNWRSSARKASTKFTTKTLRTLIHISSHTWPPRSFKPRRRMQLKGSEITREEAVVVASSGEIVETTTAANKTTAAEEDTNNNHRCLTLHNQWWWALASKCMVNHILNSSTCSHPHTKWTWCPLHKWCNQYLIKEDTALQVNNLHSQEYTHQICRCNKIPCTLGRCKISTK